jgi:hypothetical protein
MCVGYLRAWKRDLEVWEARLAELPRRDSVQEAAKALKLPVGVWKPS